MKIVLDTNVLVSGIFFSGPPFEILKAWQQGELHIAISPEILDEYYRVAEELKDRFASIDAEPILTLIAANSDMVQAPALPSQVCEDPDDDKFLACALACNAECIISGDKHLLNVAVYQAIPIFKPGTFVNMYLNKKS